MRISCSMRSGMAEAGAEYPRAGARWHRLSAADHDALLIYAALCDLKLKHIGRRDVERYQRRRGIVRR